MKNNTLKIIFVFLIILLIFILFKSSKYYNKIENFENPYQKDIDYSNNTPGSFPVESEEMAELTIKINKDNLKKYLKSKEIIEKNDKKQDFGYSILKDTNKDSIGFCPLGSYYNGKFNKNKIKNIDVFSNCKKCYKCNEENGVYTAGGCIGDKDSVCKNLKDSNITHKKFVEVHKSPFLLHNQLPKHKHYTKKNRNTLKERKKDFWFEKKNHRHIKL